MDDNGFLDIETQCLPKQRQKARDYLVPSRVHKGKILCIAAITTAFQTAFNDVWF